jgi:hypothetical protein
MLVLIAIPSAAKVGSIGRQSRANLAGDEVPALGSIGLCVCLRRCRSVRHVEAMAFPILAFVFGLLFYAASSGLAALALEAMSAWVWWAALFPLALCHAISGFIAMTTAAGPPFPCQARTLLVCSLASAVTTLVILLIAIWIAVAVPLPLSQDMAIAVLPLALLGGLAGLVVAWRISPARLVRSPQPPRN